MLLNKNFFHALFLPFVKVFPDPHKANFIADNMLVFPDPLGADIKTISSLKIKCFVFKTFKIFKL